ncbi:YeeE/YedE thiosulfate transporter family protein [Vibrio sp.]|uniref:YeeE/YedE thiosulfate transporter family protein n=1 Tax=Vibrio sp. TaxID=678 RepID=UPI003D0D8A90
MNLLELSRWSPYLVGIGIGILTWLSFIFAHRPIGCSTGYTRISGIIEKLVRGKNVEKKRYYQTFVPKVDWEMMLLLGIVLGAFLSSSLSGTFKFELVPQLWKTAFGSGVLGRAVGALVGGVFIGLGARMAGGCTSGHGISGTLQLAVGSWLALICFFVGGYVAAMVLYIYVGGL